VRNSQICAAVVLIDREPASTPNGGVRARGRNAHRARRAGGLA